MRGRQTDGVGGVVSLAEIVEICWKRLLELVFVGVELWVVGGLAVCFKACSEA